MNLLRIGIAWLPIAVATTLICGLVYLTVQQNYRQSLNDPQIQLAEDAAAQIGQGVSPDTVIPQGQVDLAASLAPWVAVYDASGTPIASSGELNDAMPELPQGVFSVSTWRSYAEDRIDLSVPSDEDRFTWEPQSDVRQAVVIVHTSNNMFVASGRNMREVEAREAALTVMVGIGWLVTLVATFLAQALAQYLL